MAFLSSALLVGPVDVMHLTWGGPVPPSPLLHVNFDLCPALLLACQKPVLSVNEHEDIDANASPVGLAGSLVPRLFHTHMGKESGKLPIEFCMVPGIRYTW